MAEASVGARHVPSDAAQVADVIVASVEAV
jgi:hypothetical protein